MRIWLTDLARALGPPLAAMVVGALAFKGLGVLIDLLEWLRAR